MANTTPIPELKTQMSDVGSQIKQKQEGLTSSGDYGGTALPSYSSEKNQEEILSLQSRYKNLSDQVQKQRWYPADTTTKTTTTPEGATDPGLMGRAFDVLLTPQRAVVGAVAHAMGQGKTGSLFGDMYDNAFAQKKNTGDLLKTAGIASGPIGSIAGFIGDVALDPLTYLTFGASSLIGATARGAMKTGAKGAMEGATSNLLGKAAKLSRGVSNVATVAAKGVEKMPVLKSVETYADLAKNISGAAGKLTEKSGALTKFATGRGTEFKKLIGDTGTDFLRPTLFDPWKQEIGEKVQAVLVEHPTLEKTYNAFVYNPIKWVANQKFIQDLKENFGKDLTEKGVIEVKGVEKELSLIKDPTSKRVAHSYFDGTEKPLAAFKNEDVEAHIKEINKLKETSTDTINAAKKLTEDLDEFYSMSSSPETYFLRNGQQVQVAMLDETINAYNQAHNLNIVKEDIVNLLKDRSKIPFSDTGIKMYDDAMKSFYNYRGPAIEIGKEGAIRMGINGKKILDSFAFATDLFKLSKVAASSTAMANAVMGNMIFSHMIGENVTDPQYWKRLKQVYGLYRGKEGSNKMINEILRDAPYAEMVLDGIKANQSALRITMGGALTVLEEGVAPVLTTEKIIREMAKKGIAVTEGQVELMRPVYEKQLAKSMTKEEAQKFNLLGFTKKGEAGGTDAWKRAVEGGGVSGLEELPTGMASTELRTMGGLAKYRAGLAERVATGKTGVVGSVENFVINKMPNGFESIDQIFKTTSFIRSTVDGYTEAQIRKMRTFIKLEKDDIFEQIVDGSPRFVLTPDKALELAQVTFMNYAAMPAAIKMIRSIPLVGSPFASFVYANAAKTGSTFVHNPTAFNKISYALNEFGGTKSPLEKTAIYDSSNPSNQYYSYLGKPGMYKVPFITDNPVYVNFASMVPPLSMNMFAPETSNYATPGFPESVMNVLNKSTLMGDPVGQLLKNYVVQPMLLRDELMLRGAFGQALFPSDATTAEKIAYAARDTAEAFVPGVASFPVGIAAGLAEKTGIGPDPEWLPLYKARKTARSVMGENVMGISGKEPVMSRVAREAAGAVGVPVQSPLNIGYIESNQ